MFQAWVDYGTEDLPAVQRATARRLNQVMLAGVLASTAMFLGWSVLGAWVLAWISLSYLICSVLVRAWIWHAPHRLVEIEGVLLVLGFVHIALGAAISGYERSPLTPFLISLPVVGTTGERSSSSYAWMALGCLLVGLIFLGAWLRPLQEAIHPPPAMQAVGWVLAIVTTGLISLASRRNTDELRVELAEARDEALASADARTRFLARMSHEIRTPLHGSLGLTEVLLRSDLPPHQRELVEGILQSGRGLLSIVDQVLDLTKLDAEGLELNAAPFDPVLVVEDVLALFAVPASSSGNRLVAVVPPAMPSALIGDEARLRQILANLVSNAVKFTRNGTVCVRVSQAEGSTRFTVEDTGIGISDDEMKRLFRPYRQANRETSLRYGGTGLGLSVSRRLAERMGGDLVATSQPGRGSSFELRVPLAVAAGPSPGPWAGRRVVVVDSTSAPSSAVTAARLLGAETTRLGADEIGSGPDAVDLAVVGSDEPDLAGALARVRARWPSARAVFAASMKDPASRERARALGFDASVYEPVRREALRATAEGPPPTAELGANAVRGLRVLVVDDHPVNRRVAELMLARLGASVRCVDSGEQAVDAVRAERFDLVLMDVLMPGISGIEATRRIRSLPVPQPRVAALSASVLDEQRDACFEAGADAFLRKPLSLEALAGVLPARGSAPTPGGA